MNVNKKLVKLMDAAQPEPPTTEKIINPLRKKNEEVGKEACDNAIFRLNAEVSHLEKKLRGTLKTRNGGVKAVLEFEGICRKKGVEYLTLDAWLVGRGKLILSAKILLPTQEQREVWMGATRNTWMLLCHTGHMLSAKYLGL